MKKHNEDLEDVVVKGLNTPRDKKWGQDVTKPYRKREEFKSRHYHRRSPENKNSRKYEG